MQIAWVWGSWLEWLVGIDLISVLNFGFNVKIGTFRGIEPNLKSLESIYKGK